MGVSPATPAAPARRTRLPVCAARRVVPLALIAAGVSGCSATGHVGTADAAAVSRPPQPVAAASFTPLTGPTEAASALPDSCSAILNDSYLTTAFGQTQSGDDVFSSFAALPSIGRTGRVSCEFGIGIDMYGNETPPTLTVSMITYDSARQALARVNDTISADAAAGSLTESDSVNGHPVTIVVELPSAAPSDSADASASAGTDPSTLAPSPTLSPSPSPSPSSTDSDTAGATAPESGPESGPAAASPAPSTTGGQTELLMADGNRTFVLEIPWSDLTGAPAINALIGLMGQVYIDTLPSAGKHSAGTSS